MTFQLRHEWTPGAAVNGSSLSTCAHCETLRVERNGGVGGLSLMWTGVHYVRRALDPDRVVESSPPCVSPGVVAFRAPW